MSYSKCTQLKMPVTLSILPKNSRNLHGPNVSTTPITAMGCKQCLSLSVVQLKGKHCRKPHCRNGVVDMFGQGIIQYYLYTGQKSDKTHLCFVLFSFFTGQEFDKIYLCVGLLNRVWAMCQRLLQCSHSQHQQWYWENWESQEKQISGKCQLVHRDCIC